MYRSNADGNKVPSLACLPHVIRFLEHEKVPTDRILKLRTDMQGHPYLSRDKYRQQRASVMGIPVDPGTGQRDATNYFDMLAIDAHALDKLSEKGTAAATKLHLLAGGIAVRDSQDLLNCLRELHQEIQRASSDSKEDESHVSGSFDPSAEDSHQTIETYTPWNDPNHDTAPSISSEAGADGPSTGAALDSRLDADAVEDMLSRRNPEPVVLPAHVVNQMNAIVEEFEQAKGDDKHQIRLNQNDPATQASAPTRPKKRWLFGKKN